MERKPLISNTFTEIPGLIGECSRSLTQSENSAQSKQMAATHRALINNEQKQVTNALEMHANVMPVLFSAFSR
jgi:hypothetical protein